MKDTGEFSEVGIVSPEHSFSARIVIEHTNRLLGGLVLLYGLCGASPSCAQTSATHPDFSAAAERAEREGNKVFRWILLNGANQKPKEVEKPKAPTDAPTRAAPKGGAKPKAPTDVLTRAAQPAARRKEALTAEHEKDPERPPVVAESSAEPAKAVAAPFALPAATTASAPPAAASSTATVAEPPASAAQQRLRQHASVPAEPEEPEEDQPLVLVHQVEPDYPLVVIRRIKKGSVHLRFEVLTDGSVRGVEVVESSNPRLNQAAVDAVARWKFGPLRRMQTGEVEMGFDFR